MPECLANPNTIEAAPASRPSPRFPRFRVEDPPWVKVFLSNIRDFLTERPPKVRRQAGAVPFTSMQFGAGFLENLKDWLGSTPAVARRASHSQMLVEWRPWYRVFWENVRDVVAPRKLPPLRVTSKPVPVPEIWNRNPQFKRAQALSLLYHALLAILILVPLWPKLVSQPTQASNVQVVPLDVSPYLPMLPPGNKKAGGGGGGGEHNPVPASHGRLPKFSWTQYTPPAVKIQSRPTLPMPATVLGPPEIRMTGPNTANYGDPLAKLMTDSSGPGGGGGIGTGYAGGVGSGQGGGVGPGEGWGTGGGPPGAGENGYGFPVCVYCPSPKFSDEAIKAKYQGTVVLRFIVTPDGRAVNIQIVKGLGLGLDQQVIDAVHTYRFKPATGPDGKATAVWVVFEVTYHLL